MRMLLLSQSAGLTENLRAVRHQFREGGSFIVAGMVLALGVGAIVLAQYLTRRRQATQVTRSTGPQKLFDDLVQGLKLADDQQQLLREVSVKARLVQPTVILLSSDLFDRSVRGCPRSRRGGADSELVARTRAALFPAG